MPFQGRILMAWVLKFSAGNPHLSGFLMRLAPHLPYEMRSPYSIAMLIANFAAIVLAIWVERLTLEYLTQDRGFAAWGSLLLLYMSYFNLLVGYGIYVMPYDVVALAAFVVSVWLVLTDRYLALVGVFVLATLNRETSIFIAIFLGLYNWFGGPTERLARRGRFAGRTVVSAYVLLLSLIWLGLRLWIGLHFRNNPLPQAGHGSFELHLRQNLISLAKPQQWPLMLSLFGFTLPLLIARFDSVGNRALGRATAIIVVLWTALMLVVGVIVEIRIFSELTAFVMPCVALIVWNQWIRPAATASFAADRRLAIPATSSAGKPVRSPGRAG